RLGHGGDGGGGLPRREGDLLTPLITSLEPGSRRGETTACRCSAVMRYRLLRATRRRASGCRGACRRTNCFCNAQPASMGLRSGEYGGRKSTLTPREAQIATSWLLL